MFISESEIVAACLQRNREAQKQLYYKYSGKMKAVCFRYVNDYELAKDLTQEGFIKIFDNLDTFSPEKGKLEAWIKAIMINTTLSYLRKHKKVYFETLTESEIEDTSDQHDANIFDSAFSEKELREAVNSLEVSYKTVFNLFVFDNLSHREIGIQLNIGENTSRTRLKRARQRIRDYLNQILKSKNVTER